MSYFKSIEADGTSSRIYEYYERSETSDSSRGVYLVFMHDGVRFFRNKYKKEDTVLNAGCILSLPVSHDKESSLLMINAINAVAPNKYNSFSQEQLITRVLGLEDNAERKNDNDSWLAQMFLCFLAEMKYGRTFEDDPLFHSSYDAFTQNHLFRALSWYMDYIRCRHLASVDKNLITVRNFLSSERKWVEIITSPASELLFHESLWFDDCADELKKVYEYDESGLNKSIYKLNGNEGDNDVNKINELSPFAKITADIAAKWFFSRYRLDGILSICNGKTSKIARLYSAFLILLSICLIFSPFTKGQLQILLLSILLASPFILIYFFCVALATSHRKVRKTIRINLFIPRLFAAIAAGWMTIGLNDIVLKRDQSGQYGFDASILNTQALELGDRVSTIWLGISMTALLIMFIYLAIRRVNPYSTTLFNLIISLIIFALSYIYSIIIGSILLKILKGEWYYTFCSSDEKIYTLLLFSFIAVFVGVFIQLLFQGSSSSITSSSDADE